MERVDVLVIGSGFGGAVMACRLAQQGAKVLVLERGRRWTTEQYPSVSKRHWLWREHNAERHNGWIDFRNFGDMSVISGAGVGGGSLIYANVSIEAQPHAFSQGWPEAITYQALQPHYHTVGQMLGVAKLPDNQWTPRTRLMKESAEALGHGDRFKLVPQAITFDPDWRDDRENPYSYQHSRPWTNPHGKPQGTCVHCGNCDIGCPVQAKNTLDLNYLAVAEAAGTEIRPLHHVRTLRVLEGGGYEVMARDLNARCWRRIRADKVVLAAGSLGSTELLLRCRDLYGTLPNLSPALGKGWCSNGDFVTPAFYSDRRVAPTRGPTITSALDYLDGSDQGARYFVEDGGVPDVMLNLVQRLAKKPTLRHSRLLSALLTHHKSSEPFANMMPWFGQAVDDPGGEFRLRRRWYWPWKADRLQLDWDHRAAEKSVQALADRHLALTEATGGRPMVPPTWSLFRNLITPHPLGGCNMADHIDDGVVNHRGEVFNYPGLFVVDGAVVPRALGLNPSRTIAALAEYAASEFPG